MVPRGSTQGARGIHPPPERLGSGMDCRKLFNVLVVGGALAGGVSGCGDDSRTQRPATQLPGADAGTRDAGTSTDAGTTDDPGGGVEGW